MADKIIISATPFFEVSSKIQDGVVGFVLIFIAGVIILYDIVILRVGFAGCFVHTGVKKRPDTAVNAFKFGFNVFSIHGG
ncbi:MAG: hypothetical protein A3K03_00115 [Bdellovibrionales bacterium RIFOXYD1_FULL_44_7]|nr:MAG: hypothetical protein A3K03_00115 [Bdellovibrionales bacterium RIFOXYD1_FULL_44_7]